MEDVIRWIDIKPGANFEQFHKIVQEAIGFDNSTQAVFFQSDENWRKKQSFIYKDDDNKGNNASAYMMKDRKILAYVDDPYQRFIYIADTELGWLMHCELSGIFDERPKTEYPIVFRSEGKAPKQRPDKDLLLANPDEDDFDGLAEKLIKAKGVVNIMEGVEEELALDTGADDEEEENEEEEYGADGESLDGFSEVTEGDT